MLKMPLVAVDEESRTRPPMPPRQKNACRGHDCSRIVHVGSQRLLHKILFRKVLLFVLQSTAIHFAKYRFPFRKVQILISQSTDFHFAKYRFPFRKVQISISQSTDFHFAKCRFPFRKVQISFCFVKYQQALTK